MGLKMMLPVGHGRRLLILLSFLDALCARVGIGQGYDQAFIQTDSDLRYLVDGVATPFSETVEDEATSRLHDGDGIKVLGSPIRFDPPELDFKEQPLGLPVLRKVRVHNLNAQSSIQMLSISGNTIHFHCSFFTDKVIPPSGNTTFDVVFLGREEGLVENTLYIHTSAGSFRFLVRAVGTPNPYRLKPLVGVRMPLNSSYSPLIELHNPHSEPIQVLEMYSSGGDLHLELPSGETEGPQALWQIPPYQTKSVMKANFVARLENNHTAYIRIKTNTTGAEFLYLPLEVEVSSQPGIYCPQELIDFGLLPSNSEPRSLKLLVLNSGQKPITIQNVIVTPVTEAVSINFHPVKISPDTLRPAVIAEVVFSPSLVTGDSQYTGKIVIKSKNSQFKVQIPYRAQVLSGRLFVNETTTHFHLKEPSGGSSSSEKLPMMSRNLTVKNEFSVPVAVHNLTLPVKARKYFNLGQFEPVILQPDETKDIGVLTLTQQAWQDKILDSHLVIHTNISNMNVPLVCFHGQVETFFPGSPSQDTLDYGTLGMGEKRDLYFTIINKNPVSVSLLGWGANLTGSLVELMGVDEGNETQILERGSFADMQRKLTIPPGHYMVFRIGIHTTEEEGATNATVYVDTDYHKFQVPFQFRVAKGSLHTVPRELIFDPAFPGKLVELKLKVYSSFAEEMITDSVYTIPSDPRFMFRHAVHDGRTVIMSGEKSFVGRVVFDPGASCRADDSCYSGFSVDSKFGREWYQGLALQQTMGDSDVAIIHTLWNRLRSAVSPSSSFNITLNLDTNQVRGFLFKSRAKLVWPRVTPSERITFPLTQVGNSSYKEVVLNNPSDNDVYCHLVPLSVYPNGQKVANLLPAWINKPKDNDKLIQFTNCSTSTFRIMSIHDLETKSPLSGFGEDVESRYGVPLQEDSKAFILRAGQSAKVKLRFRPDSVDKFRQGFFVRNNLTGVELVEVSSESVMGEMKFGKWNHDQDGATLEFDMKEKHLKDCDRAKQTRYSPPVLTVKRSFKAKNTGLTSLYISGFDIEGEVCEGYGFKVLNCDCFTLEPSETREINIAFTPDFTLSKVTRMLTMHTSLSPERRQVNYTLVATVPSHMLSVCANSLPRPQWESYLFYGVNLFMFLMVVIVLVTAFIESDRILKCTMMFPMLQYEPGQVFDLRNVADKVNQELRNGNGGDEQRLTPYKNAEGCTNSSMMVTVQRNVQPSVFSRAKNKLGSLLKKATTSLLLVRSEPQQVQQVEEDDDDDDENEELQQQEQQQQQQQHIQPQQQKQQKQKQQKRNVSSRDESSPVQSGKKKNSNKKNSNNNLRKKSLTKSPSYVLDDIETSSTTTESSTVDEQMDKCDHNSPDQDITATSNGTNNKKARKRAKGQQQQQQQNQISPDTSNNSSGNKVNNNKTKLKCKQTSVENQVKKTTTQTNKPEPLKESKTTTPAVVNGTTTNNKKVIKQAKVKPNERRNGSPNYDKPPRMQKTEDDQQQQQQPLTPASAAAASASTMSFFTASSSPAPLSSIEAGKQKAKVTPVGKILPEIKKTENLGAQYGAVGTKPLLQPRKSTWQDSPAEPKADANQPPASFLSTQPQPSPSRSQRSPQHLVHQTTSLPSDMEFGQFNSSLPQQQQQQQQFATDTTRPPGGLNPGGSPTHSLMKSLQLQRRQQTEEYLRQQSEWPGFGGSGIQQPSYLEGLWDRPLVADPQVDHHHHHAMKPPSPGPSSSNSLVGNMGQVWPEALWGNSVGLATTLGNQSMRPPPDNNGFINAVPPPPPPTVVPPHPPPPVLAANQEYNSRQQHQGGIPEERGLGFNPMSLSSIWGSPKKEQQQQQQQQQQPGSPTSNNDPSNWSTTLFRK